MDSSHAGLWIEYLHFFFLFFFFLFVWVYIGFASPFSKEAKLVAMVSDSAFIKEKIFNMNSINYAILGLFFCSHEK